MVVRAVSCQPVPAPTSENVANLNRVHNSSAQPKPRRGTKRNKNAKAYLTEVATSVGTWLAMSAQARCRTTDMASHVPTMHFFLNCYMTWAGATMERSKRKRPFSIPTMLHCLDVVSYLISAFATPTKHKSAPRLRRAFVFCGRTGLSAAPLQFFPADSPDWATTTAPFLRGKSRVERRNLRLDRVRFCRPRNRTPVCD